MGWHCGSREKTTVELAGEVISAAGGLHGLYDVSVQVPIPEISCPPLQCLAGQGCSSGGANVDLADLAPTKSSRGLLRFSIQRVADKVASRKPA